MIKIIVTISVFLYTVILFGQEVNFPEWGVFSEYEKNLTVYEKDSTANAVVLNEVGYSYFQDFGDYKLIKKYYTRIKILSLSGLDLASIEIPTYKEEKIKKINASTTNFDEGMKTVFLKKENIYITKESKEFNKVSFALPNVKVGSVIEYSYELHTPYKYSLAKGWNFQDKIPKITSNFTTKIPGYWQYNITTQNLKNLKPKQHKIKEKCMTIWNSVASCLYLNYEVNDIPAFIKEDFSTSEDNFMMKLNFELKTFTNTDLTKSQYTRNWKHADNEVFNEWSISKEFDKTKVFKNNIPTSILKEEKSLEKANKVYEYIQKHFNWNDKNEIWEDFNIKKVFESKEGSIAEINLSLVNALRAAGFEANFVLLSTRDNGFPLKLHPTLQDFNYLIAHLNINGKNYFLDATDKTLPFGLLPFKCLNQDFRIFDKKKGSYWYDFKPIENNTSKVYAIANITEDSKVKIKARVVYSGYKAYDKREIILENSVEEYKDEIDAENEELGIINHTIENLKIIDKPLIEIFEFESEVDLINNNTVYLKPFIIKDFKTNPFTLKERKYPVDLGYKRKFQYNLSFNVPDGYTIKSIPKSHKMILPNNGGSLIYLSKTNNKKITINFTFSLDKIIYQPEEYNLLKEFISQLIIAQNEMILLIKE